MDTTTIAITASVATAGTSILALILSTMHRSATTDREDAREHREALSELHGRVTRIATELGELRGEVRVISQRLNGGLEERIQRAVTAAIDARRLS